MMWTSYVMISLLKSIKWRRLIDR